MENGIPVQELILPPTIFPRARKGGCQISKMLSPRPQSINRELNDLNSYRKNDFEPISSIFIRFGE